MRSREDGGRTTLAVLVSAALSLVLRLGTLASFAPCVRAQSQASDGRDEVFEKVDPYTKGESAALDKLGYVSLGPFLFAEGIRTQDVEETLGGTPLLWVETAHFKLGLMQRTYKLPGDPREERKLDDELKRLKTRLPGLRPPRGKIDPWLRLHLWAQRLEDLYTDFQQRFRLQDADFAPRATGASGVSMGNGPYLGMEMKFTVLLTDKASATARFLKRYLNLDTSMWQRWYLPGGSALLAMNGETLKSYGYETDTALHALVASEVTLGFVEAFRNGNLSVPLWLRAGLAHVASRRVDERYTVSALGTSRGKEDEDSWRWEPRVYGLVFNKAAKPWSSTLAWSKWEDLHAQGHLLAWSRVEWLLGRKDADPRALLMGLSDRYDDVPEADRQRVAAQRQEAAFQAALHLSVDEADAEWRRYVLKSYEKK